MAAVTTEVCRLSPAGATPARPERSTPGQPRTNLPSFSAFQALITSVPFAPSTEKIAPEKPDASSPVVVKKNRADRQRTRSAETLARPVTGGTRSTKSALTSHPPSDTVLGLRSRGISCRLTCGAGQARSGILRRVYIAGPTSTWPGVAFRSADIYSCHDFRGLAVGCLFNFAVKSCSATIVWTAGQSSFAAPSFQEYCNKWRRELRPRTVDGDWGRVRDLTRTVGRGSQRRLWPRFRGCSLDAEGPPARVRSPRLRAGLSSAASASAWPAGTGTPMPPIPLTVQHARRSSDLIHRVAAATGGHVR